MQVYYGNETDSDNHGWVNCSMEVYKDLVLGNVELTKIPFESVLGEVFYVVDWDSTTVQVAAKVWEGTAEGYAYKLSGNFFRTGKKFPEVEA